MNTILLVLYAPLIWALALAFTRTEGTLALLEGPVAPLAHGAALLLGYAVLGFAPVGRPASLRAGERAFTLSASYAIGVLAWMMGLGTTALCVLAGAGLVLRLCLGPGAMIPGRSPGYVPSRVGRWILMLLVVGTLVAFFGGYPGALAVLVATCLCAEGLRVADMHESRRWTHSLVVTFVALQTNPYLTLAVVATLLGTLHAYRRADRRGWFLAFVGASMLGLQGFVGPALTLVGLALAFSPSASRRDALPMAVVATALILLGVVGETRPLSTITIATWATPALLGLIALHMGYTRLTRVRTERWLLVTALVLFGWSLYMPNLHGAVFAAGVFVSGRWNLIERAA